MDHGVGADTEVVEAVVETGGGGLGVGRVDFAVVVVPGTGVEAPGVGVLLVVVTGAGEGGLPVGRVPVVFPSMVAGGVGAVGPLEVAQVRGKQHWTLSW